MGIRSRPSSLFNRRGELGDRPLPSQRYRASSLNLIVAAIILSNTRTAFTAVGTETGQSLKAQALFRLQTVAEPMSALPSVHITELIDWCPVGRLQIRIKRGWQVGD